MAIHRSQEYHSNNGSNEEFSWDLMIAEQQAREAVARRDPRVLKSLQQQKEAMFQKLHALIKESKNKSKSSGSGSGSGSRSRSGNNKAKEWRLAFIAKFQAERRLETIQNMDDHDGKEEALRSALATVSEAKSRLQSVQYK